MKRNNYSIIDILISDTCVVVALRIRNLPKNEDFEV